MSNKHWKQVTWTHFFIILTLLSEAPKKEKISVNRTDWKMTDMSVLPAVIFLLRRSASSFHKSLQAWCSVCCQVSDFVSNQRYLHYGSKYVMYILRQYSHFHLIKLQSLTVQDGCCSHGCTVNARQVRLILPVLESRKTQKHSTEVNSSKAQTKTHATQRKTAELSWERPDQN